MIIYILEEPVSFDETRIVGAFKSKLDAQILKDKLDKPLPTNVKCEITEVKLK